MKLVIDCFKLVKGAGKSIGIYNLAKCLTEHLGRENLRRRKLRPEGDHIFVLGNALNRKDFEAPGVVFVEVDKNPLNKITCIWWELFAVAGYARRYGADRILFPRGYRPLFYRGKDTIIIHDLIPFYYHTHYPEVFNKAENAYIMARLKGSIRRADRVITISEYSREDILRMAPGCAGRLTVINNGLNDIGGAPGGSVAQEAAPGGYIVAVTSTLPHKNAAGILKTYDAYYNRRCRTAGEPQPGGDAPLPLVVIGIRDTQCYPIGAAAASHVTCYPFIEKNEEMNRLLSGARLFLFLSYMEGFGFPPLEAMQLGVPVICSDRSSLPEVVGDAGILVDPDDVERTADAIERVEQDAGLRALLVSRGKENISRFSWESRTELYWEELLDEQTDHI